MGYRGDKTNFLKEIQAFAAQVQELEDALWSLYDNRNVNFNLSPTNTARNVLDDFGDNVGCTRGGRTDAAYSLAIRAQIQANQSCGEPERLIALLKALTSTARAWYSEHYPANIDLAYLGTTAPTGLRASLQRIATGGVQVNVTMLDTTTHFRFDTAGYGFDDGHLGTLII